MKLLVAVPSYLPGYRYGGPIRSVHGAARELVARGHRVRVVTTDCDQGVRLDVPPKGLEIDGVEVRHCRWSGPAQLRHAPGFRRQVEAWLADTDLVWVNGVFELCSSRAMRAARSAGVPYVVSPRGMLDSAMLESRGRWKKRAWLSMGDRRSLLGADAWHLTAELERETLPG
ncbi:MAG: glycosyltransferase, partial [Planctomycetota bacterium]